ncbi:MAG TPA: hypothetical protein VGQ06_03255 [Gemmatimonadales bacterium]|jgi:hypothetical protein|nr:hypothetical protein [Gemmatimonadales bacterium]
MTQIGEMVTAGEVTGPGVHDSATCPWEQQPAPQPGELEEEEAYEDNPGQIPKNLGKKLGDNLDKAGENEPMDAPGHYKKVWIKYKKKPKVPYFEGSDLKEVQAYRLEHAIQCAYEVQYAPHHLIPGNASLKNSIVVRYLGHSDAIKHYGSVSKIKDKQFCGYNVNAAENGVWLPSPYALSNNNEWPAQGGIDAIKERRGRAQGDTVDEETFKMAFTVKAIEQAGGQLQFHMAHPDYSNKVREMLNTIGTRLWLISISCPFAAGTAQDGKWNLPAGMVERLNRLSANLKSLVTGPIWRPPLYTDGLTQRYANERLGPPTPQRVGIERII